MTERELLYIKTIAEEKSISKASEKLFLSQPSLSKCLQVVESTLGAKLFKRTGDGLLLTFAGERYYKIASEILRIYNDFEIEVSDINNLKKGRITVGTTFYLGAYVLPVILPAFKQLCPNIEVCIVESNSTDLERTLISGKLDFAFMHAGPNSEISRNTSISFSPLFKDPFLLATRKGHPLSQYAKKREGSQYSKIDLTIFSSEPFILVSHERRIGQVAETIFQNANIEPNIVFNTENYETARRLASVGVGSTFIPYQYAGEFSNLYPIDCYAVDSRYKPYWTLGIAIKKNTYISKAAKFFIKIANEKVTPLIP